MSSRSFAAALIVTTCTAAAGGSYLALRENSAAAAQVDAVTGPEPVTAPASKPSDFPEGPPSGAATGATESQVPRAMRPALPRRRPAPAPIPVRQAPVTRSVAVESSAVPAPATGEPIESSSAVSARAGIERAEPAAQPEGDASAPSTTVAEASAGRSLFEIVVPSSAVIGLEIENTITSEQAQVEDRVDARVTRDVYADGRLAIPAGSRVIGAVSVVDRGGKLKNPAKLGVRFHTLVLAGGHQVPMRTDAIYREGDSPGAESSRKIGGAAIGGAVIGAILGGGKGAATGASVGAAGGTAAVMAGGRNPAILGGGSVVTVRLSAPVTLEVER